jgi:hypothetical protein
MAISYTSAFNEHFLEFITYIHSLFPSDHELLVAKNSLIAMKKVNPKIIPKIWNTFVVGKYTNEIARGDLDFFINKDYSIDLLNSQNSDKIIEAIDRFREPVKTMGTIDKTKTIKYIQSLTKLSVLCN